MLKLHQLFFRKFTLLFVIVFFIWGGVIYFWLKDIYINETKQRLFQNIELILMHISNVEDFEAFSKKNQLDLRVTFIKADGEIIAESDSNKDILENHKQREELLQASKEGVGSSLRYSTTLNKDFLYVAKKITLNNQIYYIRIASDLAQINSSFLSLAIKMVTVFIFFIISIFIITYKLNKQLQQQVYNILYSLKKLVKKDYSNHNISLYSKEFNKITKLIEQVAILLEKQRKKAIKKNIKLEIANRQKDDIISAISHEFKNPIAIIIGYIQIIKKDTSLNQEILHKFLTKIDNNAIKISSIIDRLQLAIKLEEKKQPLFYSSFSIYNLTLEISNELKESYKNREIIIKGDDFFIQADEMLISIAIKNLIENALKYSPHHVEIVLQNNMICIKDQGLGISNEHIDKITSKHYRVNNDNWSNSLGLGLNIVKNILKLHKFTLHIKSTLNSGSEFSIIFL